MDEADAGHQGDKMRDYSERVQQLSEVAKDYLINRLDVGANIDHLVAFYTAEQNSGNDLEPAVRYKVEQSLPKHMHPSVYMQLAEMPRLSNGKIDYNNLPDAILTRGASQTSTDDQPDADVPALNTLIEILESLLDFDGILPTDNFFELGGDSITAIRLVSRAREAGINIGVAAVASEANLRALVASAKPDVPEVSSTNAPFGKAPLTPIQQWFFSQEHPSPEHWNIGGRVALARPVVCTELQLAIIRTLENHPELGVQFMQVDGRWSCDYPKTSAPDDVCLISDDQSSEFQHTFVKDSSKLFLFNKGWMIRFAIVAKDDGTASELLWVAHHLVIDQLSIQTLLTQIEREFGRVDATIAKRGLSMRDWTLACESLSSGLQNTSHLLVNSTEAGLKSPIYTVVKCTENKVVHSEQRVDTNATRQLQLLSDSNVFDFQAILISAFALAWQEVLATACLPIDIEGHGRDLLGSEVDNINSIGWFSAFFPVHLAANGHQGFPDVSFCRWVYDQVAEQKQLNGQFLLATNDAPDSQVSFGNNGRVLINFLGSAETADNSLFTSLPFSEIQLRAEDNLRPHNVELNASIVRGELRIFWAISDSCMNAGTSDHLKSVFKSNLVSLANQANGTASDSTAVVSDFPDVTMSQEDLDDFLDGLE